MTSSRWSRRGAILNLIAGGVSGAAFLGVGGRIAMWVFALATNRPPVVTLFGSVRVVLYGGIIGLLLGLLRWMVAPLLRGPRWVRGLEFGALALLVCIPGIRPPTLLTFSLFTPLFIAYGVLLEEVLRRRSMASNPLIC